MWRKTIPREIFNCVVGYLNDNDEEECEECKDGFYVSDDNKECIEVKDKIGNCLGYYLNHDGKIACDECATDFVSSNDGMSCIKFPNCDYLNEKGECERCNTGYALTYEGTSCKFENCKQLAQGNEKCSECDNGYDDDHKYYRLNSEGKCERTQCKTYDNDVCTGCFEGYYLDDKKNCEKIEIENCLVLDETNKKCKTCIFAIPPDSEGKCNLPSTLIKGCLEYSSDGKYTKCYEGNEEYTPNSKGGCDFVGCDEQTEYKYEYCRTCKAGYYRAEDDNDNYICIGFDGSIDTSSSGSGSSDSSSRNKVQYTSLIFILGLLI